MYYNPDAKFSFKGVDGSCPLLTDWTAIFNHPNGYYEFCTRTSIVSGCYSNGDEAKYLAQQIANNLKEPVMYRTYAFSYDLDKDRFAGTVRIHWKHYLWMRPQKEI